MRVDWKNLSRRLQAGVLAAGTLWVVTVTAGSDTAASALSAVREALPLGILRWELGDLWAEDQLSPAVAMTLGESPLLAAARPLVAELRRQEETEEDTPEEEIETVPVEETPLDAPEAADNGDQGGGTGFFPFPFFVGAMAMGRGRIRDWIRTRDWSSRGGRAGDGRAAKRGTTVCNHESA